MKPSPYIEFVRSAIRFKKDLTAEMRAESQKVIDYLKADNESLKAENGKLRDVIGQQLIDIERLREHTRIYPPSVKIAKVLCEERGKLKIRHIWDSPEGLVIVAD